MLPIILILSMFCQGHAVDYGTEFVTAFPENLAFYYPAQLTLSLKITTFLPTTNIVIIMNSAIINQSSINIPQVFTVNIYNAEVNQFGLFGNQSIRITSNKNITVLSISMRGDSIQTNVVPPTTRLGLEYLVPSPNYTELAVQMNNYNPSNFTTTTIVPMDFSYRLLIINAEDVNNSVVVSQKSPDGSPDIPITLGPFALVQLQSSAYWSKVTSSAKVAVIITNPCIDTLNCKCNMVAHQLRPTKYLGTKFIYPALNRSTTRLFVSSASNVDLSSASETRSVAPGSIGLLPYLPDLSTGSPLMTTSQPASVRVIQPGLIIDLLPQEMFSGCYLVHSSGQDLGVAVIIAETGQTSTVYMGTAPLSSATWSELSGTSYSWALVSLKDCDSCVIWHPITPIAVYAFDRFASSPTFYGGPAVTLSDQPDPSGCVAVPMTFDLANVTLSWQASRAYCTSKAMLLASPVNVYAQSKMSASLASMNAEGAAWLGLRRNLMTSEWYWQNKLGFNFANWDYNQPADSMCVSAKINADGNFTWSTMRCCTSMQPLCFQDLVTIGTITGGFIAPFSLPPAP